MKISDSEAVELVEVSLPSKKWPYQWGVPSRLRSIRYFHPFRKENVSLVAAHPSQTHIVVTFRFDQRDLAECSMESLHKMVTRKIRWACRKMWILIAKDVRETGIDPDKLRVEVGKSMWFHQIVLRKLFQGFVYVDLFCSFQLFEKE